MLEGDDELASAWEIIQNDQANLVLGYLEGSSAEPDSVKAEALQSLRQALARRCHRDAQQAKHLDKGAAHLIQCYETGLQGDPNYIPVLRDLALLLTTCTNPDLRNGYTA